MGIRNRLENIVRKAAVPFFIAGTIATTSVLGACNQPEPVNPPVVNPDPIVTPAPAPVETPVIEPNNSYDFAKSLGLEADYLRGLNFDSNTKEFITNLSSLPEQMRNIALDSGLTEKLINDKQITVNEAGYFKRLIGSYMKEIETMQPWLNQISEEKSLEALALNLSNFMEVSKDEMFYNLDSDVLPSLLPQALFKADGVIRKYASEIVSGDNWGRAVSPYASVMVNNINNFWEIHDNAWEVANNPDYKPRGHSIEEILHTGYFEAEAVGSTDKGINATEDIQLLLREGSPVAKAALRLYAVNLGNDAQNRDRGNWSSAEQARVELTGIDAWSIGIYSYEVVITGHDVPAIRITDDDIALLKSRSADPLLMLDIDDKHYLPIQWTRKSILRNDVDVITFYQGTGAEDIKISDLKPY